MEKQISIIIPTYNMENYIGRCLDSLIIPEFDQVEVLVVNDGSKDRSSEIAHEYADRYPNSIRVIDKENGNYGSCINTALPLATGRYVKILDADDTFDTITFSEFIKVLPKMNEDAVLTKFIIVDEFGKITNQPGFGRWKIETDKKYSGKELYKLLQRTYVPMHHIAYKRTVFSRLKYTQTEGISYTDTQWSIVPMSLCESIIFKNLSLYRYFVGRSGQTMASFGSSKAIRTLFHVMRDICEMYGLFYESTHKSILKNLIASRHIAFYMCAYNIKNSEAMDLIKAHEVFLKETYPDLYDHLNYVACDDDSNYKFVKLLRKSGYTNEIQLSTIQKMIIHLSARMHNIRSIFQ